MVESLRRWVIERPVMCALGFAAIVLGGVGAVKFASSAGGTGGACAAPVSVSVVGDSMFEVGEQRLAFLLGQSDDWEIVSWDARSGRSIRDHPTALSQNGEIIVTSFAYNDVNLGGAERMISDARQFLDTYRDRTVVWVTFSDLDQAHNRVVYDWLRGESGRPGLHIADFGAIHEDHVDAWNYASNDQVPWAGIHLDPNGDGIPVLADTMRAAIDEVAADIGSRCV